MRLEAYYWSKETIDIAFLFVEPHFFTLINERIELCTTVVDQKCHVWIILFSIDPFWLNWI